jgi:hypothetical protein
MQGMPGLLAVELPEPRQCLTNRIHGRTDRFRSRLHEVNIFGVAQWLLEQQSVDSRAAAECDLAAQMRAC